jgi:hypothetical protein
MSAAPRLSLPVAVIVGRRTVSRSGWSVPSWRVVGVVAGDNLPGPGARGVPVHGGDEEEQFLWGGLRLDLYRDAAEAYWSNLTGKQPSLFVLCTEREDGTLQPQTVTADMHEASSALEGDDRVFSATIPPEVYLHLERFVVEHHVPQERKKRKRTDWTADKPS